MNFCNELCYTLRGVLLYGLSAHPLPVASTSIAIQLPYLIGIYSIITLRLIYHYTYTGATCQVKNAYMAKYAIMLRVDVIILRISIYLKKRLDKVPYSVYNRIHGN